ncbi:hypothetical protein FB451DRAFT_1400487 [Mycena latifolia]|nr:hypothetical protein FB451DRAFT_1400487 [Mycena latifolia]
MAKAPSVSVLSREKSGENGPGRSLFCPLQHDLIMANIDINFQVGDRRPPSPTLSTQNKPVDEAGKQKLQDTLVLPVELRREIIHAALQLDNPYDLERFIHDRGSCRLIDKDTDAFITHTPSFWSHILISPRVNFESLTTSLPETFSLTIRLDVQDPDWWTLDNELWKYVRRIITTFGPRMRRCYALSLQGPSHYLIGGLLQDLDASSADLLHSLTVKFDLLHHCYAGQIHSEDENGWLGTTPPHIYNFGFSQFGPAFHPFTTISIISTSHGACPSVTYSSAPQPTLLLSQPAGCPLDWGQTMNMLSSARSMTKLVLVGVHFEQYTSHEIMVVPPPLVALETLHLDFAGSESMACSLSRLVAPYVKTLKLVFSRGYQDLACACMCPHILSTISHLTLVGECPEVDNLPDFYRLLPRVTHLDLRLAGRDFFRAFQAASSRACFNCTTNWNACPMLQHLLSTRVDPSLLVQVTKATHSTGQTFSTVDVAAPNAFRVKALPWQWTLGACGGSAGVIRFPRLEANDIALPHALASC